MRIFTLMHILFASTILQSPTQVFAATHQTNHTLSLAQNRTLTLPNAPPKYASLVPILQSFPS